MEPASSGEMRIQFNPQLHGNDLDIALQGRKIALIPESGNFEFKDRLGNTVYLTQQMAVEYLAKYLEANPDEEARLFSFFERIVTRAQPGPKVEDTRAKALEIFRTNEWRQVLSFDILPARLRNEAVKRAIGGLLQGPDGLGREGALAIVRQDGLDLQLLPDHFRDDKEIVLNAVQQNPAALAHASARLKDDKEVVLTAVNLDPSALAHASDSLQRDSECIAATQYREPTN